MPRHTIRVCERCGEPFDSFSDWPICGECDDSKRRDKCDTRNGHDYGFLDRPTYGERLAFGFHALHGDADD